MKRILLVAFAPVLIVTSPVSNSVRIRNEINTDREVRQRIQVESTSAGVEVSNRFSEQRRENIRKFFDRMLNRFEAMVERLQKLIDRIEARMDKIGDVDKTDLDKAKAKLANAKADINTLKADFEAMLASDTPKEVFKDLGQQVRNITKQLVEIHRLLVTIIGDLKGLRVGNEN